MVDRAEIEQAFALQQETNQIHAALAIFDGGGVIIQMMVAVKADQPYLPPVNISTAHVIYPPQMVDAIKQALNQRLAAIDDELKGMGVSGVQARAG